MQSLSLLLDTYTPQKQEKSAIRSERAHVISLFVEEINRERAGTKWPLIQPRAVAIKVGHLKSNFELYAFLKMCQTSKSGFSKCFFGALKVRK